MFVLDPDQDDQSHKIMNYIHLEGNKIGSLVKRIHAGFECLKDECLTVWFTIRT